MIMKKFILMIMLMFVSFGAFAQTAIETPKILDNVYIGINGGATTPLDFARPFKNVNPTAGLVLGKDITPIFGIQAEGTAWFQDHNFSQSKKAIKGVNVGLNGTVNLSNLFLGYNGKPRKFEVSTVTGLGSLFLFDDYRKLVEDNNELTAKTALNLTFNVKDKHQFYIQPAVLWNLTGKTGFDDVQFNKNHAQFGVFVGYNYKFKTSNGTHNFKLYDIGEYERTIEGLKAELAKKPTEITKEIIRERIVNVAAENTVWVPFAFDKANLTDEAKFILDNFKNAGAVNVDGYASWEDGSNAEHNKALSIARAQTVTNYLKGMGVKVNQTEGHGATSITSQRCVIVTLVK